LRGPLLDTDHGLVDFESSLGYERFENRFSILALNRSWQIPAIGYDNRRAFCETTVPLSMGL
jgi:hypothetical protein